MQNDSPFLINKFKKSVIRTEVVRSFSYTLSNQYYGGNQYENQSFFCSQKAECSIDDAEDVSEQLFQFCQGEVRRAVIQAMAKLQNRRVA